MGLIYGCKVYNYAARVTISVNLTARFFIVEAHKKLNGNTAVCNYSGKFIHTSGALYKLQALVDV